MTLNISVRDRNGFSRWIVDLVSIVCDELETGSLGVEHLAAAGHEPGLSEGRRTQGIGDPDKGGLRLDVASFQGTPPALA